VVVRMWWNEWKEDMDVFLLGSGPKLVVYTSYYISRGGSLVGAKNAAMIIFYEDILCEYYGSIPGPRWSDECDCLQLVERE